MGARWLVALALWGCGPEAVPHFVDAHPADASPGGTSSHTLQTFVYWMTETTSGVPPSASSLFVFVTSISGEIVDDADVQVTVVGTGVSAQVPRFSDGAYAVDMDAWPPQLQVDIHRGRDFIEGIALSNIDVHEVTVVGRAAVAPGSPIHVSWTPNGDDGLLAGVGVRSGSGAYTIQDYDLPDSGEYVSRDPAFPGEGGYTLEMDRYRVLDINSLSSGGYVDLYVIDMLDVVGPPPPDGLADAGAADGSPDAPPDGPADAPPDARADGPADAPPDARTDGPADAPP